MKIVVQILGLHGYSECWIEDLMWQFMCFNRLKLSKFVARIQNFLFFILVSTNNLGKELNLRTSSAALVILGVNYRKILWKEGGINSFCQNVCYEAA